MRGGEAPQPVSIDVRGARASRSPSITPIVAMNWTTRIGWMRRLMRERGLRMRDAANRVLFNLRQRQGLPWLVDSH